MDLSDIQGRICSRLEWDPTNATALALTSAAVNEGQRLFCFLTLSLEANRPFILTPGQSFYRMLDEGWADWLVPLRLSLSSDTSSGNNSEVGVPMGMGAMFNEEQYSGLVASNNPKLRPASLYEMAAASDTFITDQGTPSQYGCIGWDLLFFNSQAPAPGQKLNVTYARSCVPLVNPTDVPEIHRSDSECLIDYGTWRLRSNEGGQELASADRFIQNFISTAKERADQVRARSLAMRYDRQPFELEGFDYSRILKTRLDLPPYRKQNRWTGVSP